MHEQNFLGKKTNKESFGYKGGGYRSIVHGDAGVWYRADISSRLRLWNFIQYGVQNMSSLVKCTFKPKSSVM